ncbi:MAG: PD-(D/E)XK nuclease family protein, partial [Flavobacteriaceae bacterium]
MEQAQEVYFAPTIYSIEDFIAQVSGIDIMNPTQVLLEAYKVYTQNQKLSFSDYLLWAEPLLNDFNELDRNLVVPEDFFGYLSQVKALERWELKTPATDLMKDYLKFWEGLLPFYNEFSAHLLQQGSAYQGLVYRRAAEDLSHYLSAHGDKPHVFIGFNALNPAEELIIQEMLAQGNNQIFWDMDECFVRDERHSVSQFVRTYLDQWPYYRGRSSQGGAVFSHAFKQQKAFNLIESDSDQGQVQAMGQILRDLPLEKAHKTAIVLADESLLIPVLYAIPKEIKNINITMGYPLKAYPGVWFFESLLQWHKSSAKRIHHSLLLKILTHPFGQLLLSSSHEVVTSVQKNHQLFVALDYLKAMVPEHQHPTLE